MSKIIKDMQFRNHTLTLETGEISCQANGVFASMNSTQVSVTVVGKKEGSEKYNFFPLTVNYQEKTYAEPYFLVI